MIRLLTPYVIEPERAAASGIGGAWCWCSARRPARPSACWTLPAQRLDQRPGPILYVGPNKQFLNEQFEPRVMALLDEAPSLTKKVARGKRMTKTRKVIGGRAVPAGAFGIIDGAEIRSGRAGAGR